MFWQKRIVAKIKEVAADPYAPNRNLTRLQGRDAFRLRVGDLAGESAAEIWREYRALTQQELARTSNISRAMIAAMEAGHKTGSITTLKKLAAALRVDLENLI